MKNAFTLIEALAIIVVLIGISLIVVPKINLSIDAKKEKDYEEMKTSIENAARNYISNNYDIENEIIPSSIALKILIEENLISDSIKNPKTGYELNPNSLIKIYKDDEDVYIYEFDNEFIE